MFSLAVNYQSLLLFIHIFRLACAPFIFNLITSCTVEKKKAQLIISKLPSLSVTLQINNVFVIVGNPVAVSGVVIVFTVYGSAGCWISDPDEDFEADDNKNENNDKKESGEEDDDIEFVIKSLPVKLPPRKIL